MNVKKLYEELGGYIERSREYGDDGNKEVVIITNGIGGPHSKITGVSPGIDWYHGKIILSTESRLSKINSNAFHFYREQYLLKHSNLKKVRENKGALGIYKKKIQPSDPEKEAGPYKKVTPEMWLWLQLKEEEKAKFNLD